MSVMKPGIYERTDGSMGHYHYVEIFDNNTYQPFCDPTINEKRESVTYDLTDKLINNELRNYKLTEIKTREEAYFIKFL